jgi:hypothetical protein
MFGTLQDRLIKELAKAGLTEIDAANAWLRQVYLGAHNARFAQAAALPDSAFVPVADAASLAEILCGARGRARQHGAVRGAHIAAAAEPAACALRQGAGARAPIPGRRAGAFPRPAPHRTLPRRRRAGPEPRQPAAVLAAVKARPGERAASCTQGAPAGLDRGGARRRRQRAGRDMA